MTRSRAFTDPEGSSWQVELVSHGRTSGYLNPRVQRPVVQFTCISDRRPRRYAPLPPGSDSIDDLEDAQLVALLGRSHHH